jgi:hypothetical protein
MSPCDPSGDRSSRRGMVSPSFHAWLASKGAAVLSLMK